MKCVNDSRYPLVISNNGTQIKIAPNAIVDLPKSLALKYPQLAPLEGNGCLDGCRYFVNRVCTLRGNKVTYSVAYRCPTYKPILLPIELVAERYK